MKLVRILAAVPMMAVSAIACPDCTLQYSGGIIEPQTVAAKTAMSDSTLCMLGLFLLLVGFLVWSMIKTCRELAAQRALSQGTSRS
jgi:hypothetical protein